MSESSQNVSRTPNGKPVLRAWIYTAASFGDPPALPSSMPVRGARALRFAAFLSEGSRAQGWEARRLVAESPDPLRNVQVHQVMSHRHFPQADCTLWMDASLALAPGLDLERLVRGFLRTGADILAFPHREEAGVPDCRLLFRRGNNRVKRFNELWEAALRAGPATATNAFSDAARESGVALKYLPRAGRRIFGPSPAHDQHVQTMRD